MAKGEGGGRRGVRRHDAGRSAGQQDGGEWRMVVGKVGRVSANPAIYTAKPAV